MIEIKYNINFNRLLKEFKQGRLADKKLQFLLNREVAPDIVKNSIKYIKAGKVEPVLPDTNPRKRKDKNAIPLFDTGSLTKSLFGTMDGIIVLGNKQKLWHHTKEGGYSWEKPDGTSVRVPQRKFITADIPSEDKSTKKVYKKFEKILVKYMNKRLRNK